MKKNKKNSKKNNKIIVITVIIVIFILILVLISVNKNTTQEENILQDNSSLNQNLTSVEEVVKYLESTFISMYDSKTDGYDLDINVVFKYKLYENDESKEIYFTNFYEKIAMVTNFKSFRIIDNVNNIVIEVKCNSNGISEVKINGETNYFKLEESKRSALKANKIKEIDLEVNSSQLQDLIDNNWNPKKVNLGTKESSFYKYDIYFDEGYDVRTIQGKVFNIVFTKKYNSEVVAGYKPGDAITEIQEKLGEGFEEQQLIGYKTEDFYVWFSDDEISIYPRYSVDYEEFEELANEYEKNPEPNNFMYKITDIWQDYDLYTSSEGYVQIKYTNKGMMFEYSVSNKAGIQIFENYSGELKDNFENYKNVYYQLDKPLSAETEVDRRYTKLVCDNNALYSDPLHASKEFCLITSYNDDESYSNVKIKSLNEDYPDYEFDDSFSFNTYIWADDSHLIYSIKNNGIYIYNAKTRENTRLLDGKKDFNITDYDRENSILIYDETEKKINLDD